MPESGVGTNFGVGDRRGDARRAERGCGFGEGVANPTHHLRVWGAL